MVLDQTMLQNQCEQYFAIYFSFSLQTMQKYHPTGLFHSHRLSQCSHDLVITPMSYCLMPSEQI